MFGVDRDARIETVARFCRSAGGTGTGTGGTRATSATSGTSAARGTSASGTGTWSREQHPWHAPGDIWRAGCAGG